MKTKWEEPKKELNTTNNALREKSGKEKHFKINTYKKRFVNTYWMSTHYIWEYLPRTTNTQKKNQTQQPTTKQQNKKTNKQENQTELPNLSMWHKGYMTYKGYKTGSSNPLVATHYPRKIWNNILKILEERKCEAMILDLKKLTFKCKRHIQTVINTQNLEEYFSYEPFVWNLLENKSWIMKMTIETST